MCVMADFIFFECQICDGRDSVREGKEKPGVCVSCRTRPAKLRLVADRLDQRWEESGEDPRRFWLTPVKLDRPRTHLLRERADRVEQLLLALEVEPLPAPPAFYPLGRVA